MAQRMESHGGTFTRFTVSYSKAYDAKLIASDFSLVNWGSIAKCVPAMFALTFFGIIHVPINVPSLAFALKKDDLDLNRELLAHGASNAISGIFGSVQNYLVYTNSLIVIKSGGGSRIGGLFIALATGVIMMIGSCIIGYIPRMMVGALIYILGFSLIIEAVWQSRKKLKRLEYLTVGILIDLKSRTNPIRSL